MEITDMQIQSLGEMAVQLSFGSTISPQIHQQVRAVGEYIEAHPFAGYEECVLSYTAVTILYDPFVVRKRENTENAIQFVMDYAKQAVQHTDMDSVPKADEVTIPVCYGGDYGPDLEEVAQTLQMTPEEVVRIHTSGTYLVYMIGFCPGYPYMGGLDKRLWVSRRKTPRLVIPARSVAIAGQQAGVYPIETPGGWQLLGRSAVDLFTPDADTPSLLKAGDIVRFKAIPKEEYKKIRGDRS